MREDVLPALGLTITEAAKQLGVTRTALSRVLNGKPDRRVCHPPCNGRVFRIVRPRKNCILPYFQRAFFVMCRVFHYEKLPRTSATGFL
ncbi:helix-turn-helix transcriptional regulator [Methylovulum psychrotolerans]|uniref:helix-turn-helix transcriptional regulator n=1 Tax=Methylovulum psychrotolerans TaxID=1704499 RepID=UPI003D15FE61